MATDLKARVLLNWPFFSKKITSFLKSQITFWAKNDINQPIKQLHFSTASTNFGDPSNL